MHQWPKDIVTWRVGDTVYLSVVFSWQMAEAEEIARAHKGRVVAGGPAVSFGGAPWAETPGGCEYDVLGFHNPCATFTTRGCPNKCPYCIVPKTEGGFRELDSWKPAPLICDNNLLACSESHFTKVIDSLRPFPACDFNQGLDARLFTKWHAEQIATLRKPKVRFAIDRAGDEYIVADTIATARAAGLRDFGVYVLIGYEGTPLEALGRLELVRSWGIRPNPMRYQPLDATAKNAYVAPGWTEAQLRRMVAYYSRLRWREHIPYAEFRPVGETLFEDK